MADDEASVPSHASDEAQGHAHGHEHDGSDGGGTQAAHEGVDRVELSPLAYRMMAVRDLLVEREVVSQEALDTFRDSILRLSPVSGARVVARAWLDDDFRARLLMDAQSAAAELGIAIPDEPKIIVLENREDVHHLVVCTLCSCYPRALLGRPPDWYKSLQYRSRAVSEPRSVLAEFGLHFTDDVTVRVVDSTADCRYLVLPLRPAETEGMTEDQLIALVSRDSMIGAGTVVVGK